MTDTDTKTQDEALRPLGKAQDKRAQDASCRHHWLLGQPEAGQIRAVCKLCGGIRVYPAVLDDLDPGIETETRNPSQRVATAAGGARPSSTALRQALRRSTESFRQDRALRQAQDVALPTDQET